MNDLQAIIKIRKAKEEICKDCHVEYRESRCILTLDEKRVIEFLRGKEFFAHSTNMKYKSIFIKNVCPEKEES